MHSGVVTTENLGEILRGLSQRRRQGVLEISRGSSSTRISFVAGRIVDVSVDGRSPIEDVTEALRGADIVGQDFEIAPEATYSDLFAKINRLPAGTDTETFASVITHCA